MLLAFYETEWFAIILTAFATGLGALITYGFSLLIAWLKEKIKNDKLRSAVLQVTELVENSVAAVNQTFVDQLKEDGVFNKEKQEEALKMTLNQVLTSTTATVLELIEKNYGDVVSYVVNLIESTINKKKKA